MNHVVNQRMGKRQPIRWSLEGSHLLLKVRCAMLHDRLEGLCREWYPLVPTAGHQRVDLDPAPAGAEFHKSSVAWREGRGAAAVT